MKCGLFHCLLVGGLGQTIRICSSVPTLRHITSHLSDGYECINNLSINVSRHFLAKVST